VSMLTQLQNNASILAIGAILTCVTMFWGNIKSFFVALYSIFIVEIEIDYDVRKVIFNYLNDKKLINNFLSRKKIYGYFLFYKPLNMKVTLPVNDASDNILFFSKGIFPVYITRDLSSKKNTNPSIAFLRFSFNHEKLIKKAFDYELNNKKDLKNMERVYVKKFIGGVFKQSSNDKEEVREPDATTSNGKLNLVGYKFEDTLINTFENNIDNFSFNPDSMNALNFCIKWKESQEWYKNKSIPWRLGLLLFGKPGTGKSSYCKTISTSLNVPIFIFDIATMSNDEFNKFWNEAKKSSPCITLIEDIDRVFDKDKNMVQDDNFKQHLTFDCLLNCISGVENNDGIITVITANNYDRIDESLAKINSNGDVSRPGRIDFILKFDVLDKSGREKVANKILSDYPEVIEKTIEEGVGETGAQFTKRCINLALSLYWENKKC